MESYISISILNDFIFCPRSIYFHYVHGDVGQEMYHTEVQINGKEAHRSIETKQYTTKKDVLIGIDVYCEKYNIAGKIDIFNIPEGKLIERKNRVTKIYDGYVFQVYAQTFSLIEMGYEVKKIIIYDKTKNINYPIPLPWEDDAMFNKFEKLIDSINSFSLNSIHFKPNPEKCKKCIYSDLCDYYLC